MSSVSSTGPDYGYYQQQISDLEDQNAQDRKKADERENDRISNLERKYDQNLRDQEQDSNRTIGRAKESANSALSSERENHKAEINRLRHDTYDRYGRVNRDENNEYRQRLDGLEDTLEQREKQDRDNLRATEDAYTEKMASRDRAAQENTRRAVEDVKEKLGDERDGARSSARRAYRNLAEDSSKRYNELDRRRNEEIDSNRHQADQAVDEARTDYARRLGMARKAYEKNTSRQEEALRDGLTDHADRLRASHERETRDLRERMGDLIDAEKQYVRSGAQAKADVVKDYEDDWRGRLYHQNDDFQRQVADLKSQNNRTESALSHQNYEALREKDDYLAHTLNAQTQKHYQAMNDLEKAYQKDHDEMAADWKKDSESKDRAFEARMADVARKNHETLENQSKVYGESARRQRLSDRQDLMQAEASLHEQRTSPDTALISPAAEASMRRQIASQYEKTAQADQQRNHRETERMRDDYKQRFTELADGDRLRNMQASRQIASERDGERAEFTTHVADLEYEKNAALSSQERDHARETEKLTKNYSRLINHQNQQRDEQLNDVRGSALSKIDGLREEAEFNQRMATREFNNKQNQLTHDYEKKLSDQKTDYEDRLADQKLTNDTAAREKERRYRDTLDQQSRAYEHKLAQQDAQFKERERFLSETYQDEIDKLKRSNQLLIQKRS